MKLDDLMGSLRTFKMNLKEKGAEKKNKGVGLKDEIPSKVEDHGDMSDQIAFLTKNFGRIMRNVNRRG